MLSGGGCSQRWNVSCIGMGRDSRSNSCWSWMVELRNAFLMVISCRDTKRERKRKRSFVLSASFLPWICHPLTFIHLSNFSLPSSSSSSCSVWRTADDNGFDRVETMSYSVFLLWSGIEEKQGLFTTVQSGMKLFLRMYKMARNFRKYFIKCKINE